MSNLIVKTPDADLRSKSGHIMDLSLIGALLIMTVAFATNSGSYEEKIQDDANVEQMEIVNTPPTEQLTKPPPPSRPQIPIEAEDEDEVDEVTIDDTDVDIMEEYTDIEAPDDDDEPLEFFAVSEKPSIIKKGAIRYPSIAQKAGIEGMVLVEFIIDEKGLPIGFRIIKGHPMLNDAALAAAKDYRFTSAKQGDKPVKVKWQIPFRFRLRN